MFQKKDSVWDETVSHPFAGKLERWGRKFFYRLASFCIKKRIPVDLSLQKIERILIIKEPYRMGDLLQITPALRALRKNFPQMNIGLVIQDRNYEIFKNNPDINEIFLFEKRKFNRFPWKIGGFLMKIRQRKFDLAVTLETERTHLTNDLIAYFSGAPYRMRYDGTFLGNADSNAFYDVLSPTDGSLVHEVDRNFGVFKPFDLQFEDRSLVLKISKEDINSAKEIIKSTLTTHDSQLTTGFIVIHPGAYKINNRWPLENYFEVSHKLQNRGKAVLFIIGPAETDWEERIKNQGFPVVSKISLSEMAGIFCLSQCILCNDTGVMHIAGAIGTKTVALFGETDPLRWRPHGEWVKTVQSPDKKISSIKVEEVLEVLPR